MMSSFMTYDKIKIFDKDMIISKEGIVFVVIGHNHYNDRAVVGMKYFPFRTGTNNSKRNILGEEMERFDIRSDSKKLEQDIAYFRNNYPQYLSRLNYFGTTFFSISEKNIKKIASTTEKIKDIKSADMIDELQRKAINLSESLHFEANIPLEKIGVTSSLLLDYHSADSDIDMVIHGKENFRKAIEALKTADIEDIEWWNDKKWIEYYRKHNLKLGISPEEFAWQQRKHDKGLFSGSEFSVFGIRDEINYITNNEENFMPIGKVTLKAKVTDSSESGFRPGYYDIKDVRVIEGKNVYGKIKRIVNYDREYVLQANEGEDIAARGVLEFSKTSKSYQVTVGYLESYINRDKNEFIKVI